MKLFVYGTLKRGKQAHHLLQNATFLGERTVRGFVLLDAGAYPAMVRAREGDDNPVVRGEIWDVPDEAIEAIDRWEDHPRLFVRTPIELEDGTKVVAYLAHAHLSPDLARIEVW
jgi:gamma-glutamylcyclotransferase (GGCT)/AIG2-like uncharacterized protein YtfP